MWSGDAVSDWVILIIKKKLYCFAAVKFSTFYACTVVVLFLYNTGYLVIV